MIMEQGKEASYVRESLTIGEFRTYKPTEWELDKIKVEINDYNYESTEISVDDAIHDNF